MHAEVLVTKGFTDHKALSADDIKPLMKETQSLIMTEKDAVKCRDFAEDNWWYLPVSANISQENTKTVLDKINEVLKEYGS